jgi:hypothetical protein
MPYSDMPAPLPPALADVHLREPIAVYAEQPMTAGTRRKRRLAAGTLPAPVVQQIEWDLSQYQMSVLDDFYENTLLAGSLPFNIQVATPDVGLETRVAQWLEPFSATPSEVGRWHVSGKLLLATPAPDITYDPSGAAQPIYPKRHPIRTRAGGLPGFGSPPEAPATNYGYWSGTDYSYTATPGAVYPILLSNGQLLYMLTAHELISFGHDGSGSLFQRRSTTDFSVIGRISSLNSDTLNGGGWVDGNDGILYLLSTGTTKTSEVVELSETTFGITTTEQTNVAVPGPQQAALGLTEVLTNGYRYPTRNPYNDHIWSQEWDCTNVYHVWDKTSPTLQPSTTFYLCYPSLSFTSPYAGVVDPTITYGDVTTALITASDHIVFVSATVAYFNDRPTGNIFMLNTATGDCTYVFQIPFSPTTRIVPYHYDSSTNTLWFGPAPDSHNYVLMAWVVGSNPGSMISYDLALDLAEFQTDYASGNQISWITAAGTGVEKTVTDEGVWLGTIKYNNDALRPEVQTIPFFFSWADRQLTQIIYDNTTPALRAGMPFDNGGFAFAVISSTLMWALVFGGYSSFQHIGEGIKMSFVSDTRPSPPVARFVRLTVYATVNMDFDITPVPNALWIQEAHVHRTVGGSINEVVSVTFASEENPSFPASNLINGNLVDPAQAYVSSGSEVYPISFVFDVGSTMPIAELKLWCYNDTSSVIVTTGGAPANFTIETSSDGGTWTLRRQYHGIRAWAIGVSDTDQGAGRVFDVF